MNVHEPFMNTFMNAFVYEKRDLRGVFMNRRVHEQFMNVFVCEIGRPRRVFMNTHTLTQYV